MSPFAMLMPGSYLGGRILACLVEAVIPKVAVTL